LVEITLHTNVNLESFHYRWKMNNGGKCIESRYTTKSSDTMILDGEQTLDFDPPYDLIYLWCACPDPSAQVHFEYQSSRFPKQLVVPDTNR
jgi:hypothetical protein